MNDTNRVSGLTASGSFQNLSGEALRVAIIAGCLGDKGGLMGGAERQAYYMIRALTAAGVRVQMYMVDDRNTAHADALSRMGVESCHFGWLPGLPLRLLLLVKRLRRFRPHIVQSLHNFTNAYSALAGRVLGVVSLGGLRTDLQSCLRDNGRFGKFLLTGPDAIAVNSRTAAADLIKSGIVNPACVHVLPNVIDTEAFPEPVEVSAQEDGDCVCICVSRLMPLKRIDLFLRALELARRSEPRLRGVVVGFGPEATRLEHLAAELGLLPEAVQFTGPREDVSELLRRSAMFVFCSESEGSPNVVLEAMAAGLPVITTPAGDAAELVQAARGGIVAAFGDVSSIADGMVQLARSPETRRCMGRAGRSYIAGNCDVSTLASRLFRIYSDVAGTSLQNHSDPMDRVARFSQQTRGGRVFRVSAGYVIALHEIPPARLSQLIEGLRGRPVPLSELVERKKSGKSTAGLFAITVDDGVGYNIRALAQLFQARQWPATFYLPTEYLDTGNAMPFQLWWRLKPLIPRRKLSLSSGTLDLSGPGAIEAVSRKIERMWYRGRRESYLPFTMELAAAMSRETGVPVTELEGPAPISWGEVRRLSRDSLFQFESHGVSHTAMAGLREEEIIFEMQRSRETVEEHTGRRCRHFCYPFGTPESIGTTAAPELARRFYDSAVTMSRGSVEDANPWLLPRIALYPKTSVLSARTKVLLSCAGIRLRAEERAEVELATLLKPR